MKNGFTLIELLCVVAIVAVASVASAIVFSQVNKSTNAQSLEDLYKQIQTSAIMYMDLNDSWLDTFNEKQVLYVKLGELMSRNYVPIKSRNPITKELLSDTLVVKIFLKGKSDTMNTGYVTSCIIELSDTGTETIVANREGQNVDTAGELNQTVNLSGACN